MPAPGQPRHSALPLSVPARRTAAHPCRRGGVRQRCPVRTGHGLVHVMHRLILRGVSDMARVQREFGVVIDWDESQVREFMADPNGELGRTLMEALGEIVLEGAKRRALRGTGRMIDAMKYEVGRDEAGVYTDVISPRAKPEDRVSCTRICTRGRRVSSGTGVRTGPSRPALRDIRKIETRWRRAARTPRSTRGDGPTARRSTIRSQLRSAHRRAAGDDHFGGVLAAHHPGADIGHLGMCPRRWVVSARVADAVGAEVDGCLEDAAASQLSGPLACCCLRVHALLLNEVRVWVEGVPVVVAWRVRAEVEPDHRRPRELDMLHAWRPGRGR